VFSVRYGLDSYIYTDNRGTSNEIRQNTDWLCLALRDIVHIKSITEQLEVSNIVTCRGTYTSQLW
jgi:hypothetical protein